MTRSEMDQFLESIGGLVNGYYPDRSPITDSLFFEVGEGWFPLIKTLIEDLIALGWDKQVCQVKEKFGGLRFYINNHTDEMFHRIREAENESVSICEVTGKPGYLRNNKGWYVTLCDEEYKKLIK